MQRYTDAVVGGAKAIAESDAVKTVNELTKANGAGTYDYVRDVVGTFGGQLLSTASLNPTMQRIA